MRRTVGLTAALIVTLLAAAPRRAWAQDDDKRKRAGEHVVEGDRYKEQGAYDKAAREYQKAYDLVPHPLLIFNLAQVYRLGGEREKALDHYEKYLAADPGGPAAEQARGFADKLRAEMAVKSPKKRGGGRGESSERSRWLRLGGLASAGLGAVFLGVGIKYGLDARSASDQVSDHEGPWDKETLALEKEGPRAQRKMFLFTVLGGAALIGGGVLYYMGMKTEKDGLAVTPTGSADEVGLAVVGRF